MVGQYLCVTPAAGPRSKSESTNAAAMAHKLKCFGGCRREPIISCSISPAAWRCWRQRAACRASSVSSPLAALTPPRNRHRRARAGGVADDEALPSGRDPRPTKAAGSGGTAPARSGYFQTAQAKLINRLGTRVSFTLGVHRDLGRQIAELIADVPAALAAI